MIATSTPSIEVPLIRPIARTVRIGFLPQGDGQRTSLNDLQNAFNARHSPNEILAVPARPPRRRPLHCCALPPKPHGFINPRGSRTLLVTARSFCRRPPVTSDFRPQS